MLSPLENFKGWPFTNSCTVVLTLKNPLKIEKQKENFFIKIRFLSLFFSRDRGGPFFSDPARQRHAGGFSELLLHDQSKEREEDLLELPPGGHAL